MTQRIDSISRPSMAAGWLPVVAVALAVALVVATGPAQATSAPEDVAAPPADALKSESGLAWKVLQEGSGVHPDSNDLVSVHFVGWTPQGAQFQNSRETGKPAVFNLQNVFPGWTESLLLMVIGETRRVWIPAHLGPKDPSSGPRGAAVFDIELLSIRRIPNPPEHLAAPPPDAERNAAGSFSKLVTAGSGEVKPTWDGRVLLSYTGWTTDGKTFDSTHIRNRLTAFPLDTVMPAFSEVVQQMVIGETRHLWIPAHLAAGNWAGSPRGMLIFEVHLERILAPGTMKGTPLEMPGTPLEKTDSD